MLIFIFFTDSVNFSHLCLCRGVLSMVPLQALTQDTEVSIKINDVFFFHQCFLA